MKLKTVRIEAILDIERLAESLIGGPLHTEDGEEIGKITHAWVEQNNAEIGNYGEYVRIKKWKNREIILTGNGGFILHIGYDPVRDAFTIKKVNEGMDPREISPQFCIPWWMIRNMDKYRQKGASYTSTTECPRQMIDFCFEREDD